jgi:hypothetical protein
MSNPYESFYHGLVVSKIWLCEELEKIMDSHYNVKPVIKILGGWHNLLSFMMITRRPKYYCKFDSYDKDPESKAVADRICDTWRIENPKVENHIINVLELNFSDDPKNTVYINCSVDQFINSLWYNSIPKGCVVCLQTTDIIDDSQDWEIIQKTKNIEEFKSRYPLSTVLFEGVKSNPYKDRSYNRLMLIGIK